MRTSLLNLDQPLGAAPVPARAPQAQEKERLSENSRTLTENPSAAKPAVTPKPAAAAKPTAPPAPAPATPRTLLDEEGDFELVFGRRQLASTGLILLVTLAIFSGVSYLIGKGAGSKAMAPDAVSAPVTAPAVASATSPVVSAKPAPQPAPAPSKPVEGPKDQSPLFADAVAGQVYMQVGAVDKGIAAVWAEGLRAHGLNSFVAPGPTDKMWRVLVGPLPDPQSYQRAKDVMDSLGIQTFGKRYGDSPAPAKPAADAAAAAPAQSAQSASQP